MTRLLFFDDTQLLEKQGLERRLGRPDPVPEATFQVAGIDLGFAYPTVFPCREAGGWRMLYQSLTGLQSDRDPNHFVPSAADSSDGVHWRVPDLAASVPLADRLLPNQVGAAPLNRFGEWGPSYYDGWHFQRGPREPFLANADPGRIGAGCLLLCSLIATESEIRLYSCASAHEHAVFDEHSPQRSAILMHRLRPDGFVYLETAAGWGRLKTRALLVQGDRLSFNVQAAGGQLRVGITDADGNPVPGYGLEDCLPCSADSTGWVPRWKDGARFGSLEGRAVQLELELGGGRLYAVGGDFRMLSAKEGMRYMRFGTPPDPSRWGP